MTNGYEILQIPFCNLTNIQDDGFDNSLAARERRAEEQKRRIEMADAILQQKQQPTKTTTSTPQPSNSVCYLSEIIRFTSFL